MRETILIQGAKENNLKNITVEIPRDKLIIVTGLSGSGKSSLAFDTIYAEGQRRFMESLSAFAKRRVEQLKKPDVDFVFGLSPVISIEQKTVSKNPRSTIGTMTDISDYLRLMYCTIGTARCLHCEREAPTKSAHQMTEHLLSQPPGTVVEICAPIFKIYGEDYAYLFGEIRSKGHRKVRIDDVVYDISEEIEIDEDAHHDMEVIVDKFVIRKEVEKQLLNSIQHGLRIGEGFLHFRILNPEIIGHDLERFYRDFACPEHHLTFGETQPYFFSFNEPDSACPTCSGLGTYLKVHPDLLVPDKDRSIKGGAFIKEAWNYDKNTWGGRMMYSLSVHYGFSLDEPFKNLPPEIIDILFYGSKGEKITMLAVEGSTKNDAKYIGRDFRHGGIINDIERRYKHYRQQGAAHSGMEDYLRKVMVERICPDCNGAKLKRQRLRIALNGKNINQLGETNLSELKEFLDCIPGSLAGHRQQKAGEQVLREVSSRIGLLLDIGLDYLNLNRKSATLSGGESQRIRLSTQISSGLMGMLYVLDEPSIGLHPKDNVKLIDTMRRLRDIGNTVIVVEHDEDTIRAADHVVEIGPGPGVHGGEVVAQGTIDDLLENPNSLTGQFLSGKRGIPIPAERRKSNGKSLVIRGARHNNLRNLDVEFPLGQLICITGSSGSGKSTLINEILYKKLYSIFHDSRVLSGQHDCIEGTEWITDVINIDQTPIGRTPRSNPATYIGFYDDIRKLFASVPEAMERGYTASRFSFNVKGGRCEECGGEGIVTTQLHFMPDVEAPCQVCKGTRYNEETLEIEYQGKNISDILEMSIEEGSAFFGSQRTMAHRLSILNELGLGYLKIGHPSTILSGGEAQRIKLANELGKIKRGASNLYILDEPTTGLHIADIQRLLDCLQRLVNAGNTVVVIEHHLDVIKTADYIIDLGPEGGHKGGELIACGTPEEIMHVQRSYTGQFLKPLLEKRLARNAA
jgi:excinuclease ABC subunit A